MVDFLVILCYNIYTMNDETKREGKKMIATKEQERNALEKIKKIVAELGNDSYIATAFNGAFDLAERNIEEDAAYSVGDYIVALEEKTKLVDKLIGINNDESQEIEALKNEINNLKLELRKEIQNRDNAFIQLRNAKEIFQIKLDDCSKEIKENIGNDNFNTDILDDYKMYKKMISKIDALRKDVFNG